MSREPTAEEARLSALASEAVGTPPLAVPLDVLLDRLQQAAQECGWGWTAMDRGDGDSVMVRFVPVGRLEQGHGHPHDQQH